MPFEVRLALEGPQLSMTSIRQTLAASGAERALPWSGSQDNKLNIHKWEPQQSVSPQDRSYYARSNMDTVPLEDSTPVDDAPGQAESSGSAQRRRIPRNVYLVGFNHEADAQTFVQYWHRRPMLPSRLNQSFEDGESAPIVNAELLW